MYVCVFNYVDGSPCCSDICCCNCCSGVQHVKIWLSLRSASPRRLFEVLRVSVSLHVCGFLRTDKSTEPPLTTTTTAYRQLDSFLLERLWKVFLSFSFFYFRLPFLAAFLEITATKNKQFDFLFVKCEFN